MLPTINTLGDIKKVMARINMYVARSERIRVLEACSRRLELLFQNRAISAAERTEVNAKLLPLLSQEKWRQSRSEQTTKTTTPSMPTG